MSIEEQHRPRFEDYCSRRGLSVERGENGEYIDRRTAEHWFCWCQALDGAETNALLNNEKFLNWQHTYPEEESFTFYDSALGSDTVSTWDHLQISPRSMNNFLMNWKHSKKKFNLFIFNNTARNK